MKPFQETDEMIAKFMGWFQEKHQPETWFIIKDDCKYVAYSTYNDRLGELPFHKSWDALMEVYKKICKLPSTGDRSHPPSGPLGIFSNIKYQIPDLDKTYLAIVEFIKYYNTHGERTNG